MALRLIQLVTQGKSRFVAALESRGRAVRLDGVDSVYALALGAIEAGISLNENYLWLAHSKLRQAALGAELLTGVLPPHVHGTSTLLRNGETIWQKPFSSGEDNMSHSIANLEHHHFKYGLFRKPGDVHVHFYGCGTLSFADGVKTREGDVFEIGADAFFLTLRNRMTAAAPAPFVVRPH